MCRATPVQHCFLTISHAHYIMNIQNDSWQALIQRSVPQTFLTCWSMWRYRSCTGYQVSNGVQGRCYRDGNDTQYTWAGSSFSRGAVGSSAPKCFDTTCMTFLVMINYSYVVPKLACCTLTIMCFTTHGFQIGRIVQTCGPFSLITTPSPYAPGLYFLISVVCLERCPLGSVH